MTDFLPVILNQPLDRQRYSREFKRQIVEASLTLGASIAAVAQANLLHNWHWHYRHGDCGTVAEQSTLAPVQMVKTARLAVVRLNEINPEAYLRHVLSVTADCPVNRLAELLPWNVTLTY